MIQVNTFEDYQNLLNDVINETEEYIQRFQGLGVYKNIVQQLLFVKKIIVEERRKPTFEETESTYIGSIALKNFEDNPPYADKLKSISYVFLEYRKMEFLKLV